MKTSAPSLQRLFRTLHTAFVLCCLGLGAWLLLSPSSTPATVDSNPASATAARKDRTRLMDRASTRPIETIRVGDRVAAFNPQVTASERATWTEPDWSQWLQLSLVMPKQDGSDLHIELLRSEDWVRDQVSLVFSEPPRSLERDLQIAFDLAQSQIPTLESPSESDWVPLSPLRGVFRDWAIADSAASAVGAEIRAMMVQMDLPELAITGPAIITDIRLAPEIKTGSGRVVTATFHHTSGDVYDLVIGDRDSQDTLGTTGNHPFWSVDRQDYVQAVELQIGEQVQTIHGQTKRVIGLLPRPGPEPVYNLETHGEHVYYVGKDGVLVHNSENYALITTPDMTAAQRRRTPGIATGQGSSRSSVLLGTHGNAGLIPHNVATAMRGREFDTFDNFREAFWIEMSKDSKIVAEFEQFDPSAYFRMRLGYAPEVDASQAVGKIKKYTLHHRTPIHNGGAVYDIENLLIVTPKYHKTILDPDFHYNR